MTGSSVVTLLPGDQPKPLSTSASTKHPTTIINDSPAGARAYIGSDYSCSPANSTPLDPGTSLPWAGDAQIWAIADPASPSPVRLRLTDDVGNWQPSPYAVAAATAAQLLATGVPSRLLLDYLGPLACDGQFRTIPGIDEYASLTLVWFLLGSNPNPTPLGLRVDQQVTSGVNAWLDADILDPLAAGGAMIVPVKGHVLRLRSQSPNDGGIVHVWGSNRPAPLDRISVAGHTARGLVCARPNGTLNAGDEIDLTPGGRTLFQGLAFGVFSEITNAVVSGVFQAKTLDGDFLLAHTGELAGGRVARQLALPANAKRITFFCTASNSASANVDIRANLTPAY